MTRLEADWRKAVENQAAGRLLKSRLLLEAGLLETRLLMEAVKVSPSVMVRGRVSPSSLIFGVS